MTGILRQGTHDLYFDQIPDQATGQKVYQKGHLAPAHTLSRTEPMYKSTFTYTNAVPQCQRFNSNAHWARYEDRIRATAMHCEGILYLLTGTSFAHIRPRNQQGVPSDQPNIDFFNQIDRTIAIPNSLWTAGCCEGANNNAASFAVMGNNVQGGNAELTLQISVTELQDILTADVRRHGLGDQNVHVNLFPGNHNC